ncbi:MAG TPA: hypothetical protein VF283_14405 [Bryobacteraceae bacterium]
MRIFASDTRPDNHDGEASFACPFFGTHQQHATDARAAVMARNDESTNLHARIGLKMMNHAHIDPPHDGTIKATDKYSVVRERRYTLNSFVHSVHRNRISKLPTQFGSGLGVRKTDFADGKRVQDIAFI